MLPVAVSVKLQVKYRRCDRAFPFTPHLFVIFAFGSLFVLFFVLFLAVSITSWLCAGDIADLATPVPRALAFRLTACPPAHLHC
ncbi:hypothetical protein FIBSPDRAFT_236245 [Athelia psychrophila]|uniref:Uncharacterized protein n=1 Tax=Athelia psychrophila TaxID=1759441 RepID=A0A166S0L4_9AGAM|nr:hypothetical protein FIBSPDRAFT_236245 [Fibularhizoctonia sp. CBS 109695]